MSLKKNISRITAWQPGLVEDVPDQLNKGFTKFRNVLLSVSGQMGKRTGWTPIISPYAQESYTMPTPSQPATITTVTNNNYGFGKYVGLFPATTSISTDTRGVNYWLDPNLINLNVDRYRPDISSDLDAFIDAYYPIYSNGSPVSLYLQRDSSILPNNTISKISDGDFISESASITPPLSDTFAPYLFSEKIGKNKFMYVNTPDNLILINPEDVVRKSTIGHYRRNILGINSTVYNKTNGDMSGMLSSLEYGLFPFISDKIYAKTIELHGALKPYPYAGWEWSMGDNVITVGKNSVIGKLPTSEQVAWYGNYFSNPNNPSSKASYVTVPTITDMPRLFNKKIQPGWYYYILVPIYNDGTRGMIDVAYQPNVNNPLNKRIFPAVERRVYVSNDFENKTWSDPTDQPSDSTFFHIGITTTVNMISGQYSYHIPNNFKLNGYSTNGYSNLDLFDEGIVGYTLYRSQRQSIQFVPGDLNNIVNMWTPGETVKNVPIDYYYVRDFYKAGDLKEDGTGLPAGKFDFILWDNSTNAAWIDDIPDTSLGAKYIFPGYINEVSITDKYYTDPTSSVWIDKNDSIHSSCGLYADNRLFLNDTRNPGLLLMSEIGHELAIPAELAMQIDTMGLDNPIIGIAHAGFNTFIFGDSSIVMLRPTGSATTPYNPIIISTHVGLQANISITVLDNIIYFIGNDKRLWTCDSVGNLKEVGGAINQELLSATDSVILKSDPINIAVRIMFRTALNNNSFNNIANTNLDYTFHCLIWYPRRQYMSQEVGYRDTFINSGDIDTATGNNLLQVKPKQEEYTLINYWFLHGAEREYGLTKFGELVGRDNYSNYSDTSLIDKRLIWQEYISRDSVINTYNVPLELERPIYFNNKVKVNAIILYGSGNWSLSTSVDESDFSVPELHTLNESGTEIPFGFIGRLFKLRLINEEPDDVTLSEIAVVYTAEGGTNVMNIVSKGSPIGGNV